MISPIDLRRYVLEPVLEHMGERVNSEAAIRLLLGTAAIESNLGAHLRQIGEGPAVGIYQVERPTYDWTLQTVARRWPDLHRRATEFCLPVGIRDDFLEMAGNLYWATAIARLVYWWRPAPLPEATDAVGMANYWKANYNTALGAGKPATFVRRYRTLVQPFTETPNA